MIIEADVLIFTFSMLISFNFHYICKTEKVLLWILKQKKTRVNKRKST